MNKLVKVDRLEILTRVNSYPVRSISANFLDYIKFFGLSKNNTEDKQLLELINISLNKKTLDEVVKCVENGKSWLAVKPESNESTVYLFYFYFFSNY